MGYNKLGGFRRWWGIRNFIPSGSRIKYDWRTYLVARDFKPVVGWSVVEVDR